MQVFKKVCQRSNVFFVAVGIFSMSSIMYGDRNEERFSFLYWIVTLGSLSTLIFSICFYMRKVTHE